MKKLMLLLIVAMLFACQKEETPLVTHRLEFNVTPSATISWGVNELQYSEKSGGYFEKSLTIKTGQTFYLKVDAPPVPTPRIIEIYVDGELVVNKQVGHEITQYYIE